MLNQDPFDNLPIEVMLEIFSYLPPEDAGKAALTKKNLSLTLSDNLFWKKKFTQYFPHIFSILKIDNDIDWYDQFRNTYNEEYQGLPANIRKLFSLVKEGNIEGLTKVLTLIDLDREDKSGISLLKWAQQKDNQALLDFFYQLAITEYPAGLIVDTVKIDAERRTILHWAILCHQLANTIDLLILKAPI